MSFLGSFLSSTKKENKSSTQSTTPNLPDWLTQALNSSTQSGINILNNLGQTTADQRILGFNPDELAAQERIRQGTGQYDDIIGNALSTLQQAQQKAFNGVNADDIQKFMNPYTQNVVDITKRQTVQDADIQRAKNQAAAAAAGGFGGSGSLIRQMQTDQNLNQNLSDIQYKGFSDAYDKALEAARQSNADTISAGSAIGNLATTGSNIYNTDTQNLAASGEAQRALGQAKTDFTYTNPLQTIQQQQQLLTGTLPFYGTTTTGTSQTAQPGAGPGWGSQLIGLAGTVASFLKDGGPVQHMADGGSVMPKIASFLTALSDDLNVNGNKNTDSFNSNLNTLSEGLHKLKDRWDTPDSKKVSDDLSGDSLSSEKGNGTSIGGLGSLMSMLNLPSSSLATMLPAFMADGGEPSLAAALQAIRTGASDDVNSSLVYKNLSPLEKEALSGNSKTLDDIYTPGTEMGFDNNPSDSTGNTGGYDLNLPEGVLQPPRTNQNAKADSSTDYPPNDMFSTVSPDRSPSSGVNLEDKLNGLSKLSLDALSSPDSLSSEAPKHKSRLEQILSGVNLPMLKAGLTMMASDKPFFQAIGEGGLAGANQLDRDRDSEEKAAQKKIDQDIEKEKNDILKAYNEGRVSALQAKTTLDALKAPADIAYKTSLAKRMAHTDLTLNQQLQSIDKEYSNLSRMKALSFDAAEKADLDKKMNQNRKDRLNLVTAGVTGARQDQQAGIQSDAADAVQRQLDFQNYNPNAE